LDATQLPKGQQSVKQESKQDIILRLTEGLNAQQRSVPQLPAQARARKIKVLGAKTDPRHPFAGYMVGADESVAENLEEAVGGNYLYHATGGLKDILSTGQINAARGPQQVTNAQTKFPTVCATRDWNYAVGGKGITTLGVERDAIIVLDRNAVESNFKTLGTSQSREQRGLSSPRSDDMRAGKAARDLDVNKDNILNKKDADEWWAQHQAGKDIFGQGFAPRFSKLGDLRTNIDQKIAQAADQFYTPKRGGEFEEAVVVPKGGMPIKGTMVGFYIPPASPLMKDPAVMNDPRRLDLEKGGTGRFVKAAQQQAVAEVDFNPGRRGFLKKAGAVAATAAVPTGLAGAAAKAMAPAASWASTLSAPLAGLTAVDLDDIINLLMSSKPESMISGKDPYDLDIMKSIAQDAARESWGNAWMKGNAAQAFLDAVELGRKKGMDGEDIIQDLFIVTKKQYMQELKKLSPEEVAKVKSQSLNPDNKSEPAASPTTGMSGLARAAGAQIGRTATKLGKATATTVLNQPARDMGRIEPTTAPTALPAPTTSTGMQIPKQKSRVAAKQDNELDEADEPAMPSRRDFLKASVVAAILSSTPVAKLMSNAPGKMSIVKHRGNLGKYQSSDIDSTGYDIGKKQFYITVDGKPYTMQTGIGAGFMGQDFKNSDFESDPYLQKIAPWLDTKDEYILQIADYDIELYDQNNQKIFPVKDQQQMKEMYSSGLIDAIIGFSDVYQTDAIQQMAKVPNKSNYPVDQGDRSTDSKSASPTTGMSGLARAAGAQLGRTMKNVGKATATTVLNQPAKSAALPAPSVSPSMQIPKQKSRVSAEQDKELGEAGKSLRKNYNPDGKTFKGDKNKMPTYDPDDAMMQGDYDQLDTVSAADTDDEIAKAEHRMDLPHLKQLIKSQLKILDKTEREILNYLYWHDQPLVQIAKTLGMEPILVHRIKNKALKKLLYSPDLYNIAKDRFTYPYARINDMDESLSPFNDDHSELDQFVKEEFNRDPDDINEESGAVVAHGYAYNRQDQRVAWTREFASEAEAKEWARRRNATVLSIVPKDSIEEGWKSKLAGAALAGAAAFGGGGAQANDQIAKDTQAITQAIQSGQMKSQEFAAGEIRPSQIYSHPKWLETVQAMNKKYPGNSEQARQAAITAIKQMIQQGNVREGAGTVGGNNPAAAWPDFGTAKTYESQLAEAKQRLVEAESRYVLYFNGKPASHYATEAEAKRIADSIKAKHPTVKIEIKNEMHEGDLNEVTGDLPFDTMLSKIVAGGNLQTLAAKIVAKIKKFPQYRMPGDDERDEFDWPNGYPDGHFFGDDLWIDDSFNSIMGKWKSLGPDKFADENEELSFKPSMESSNDYTSYWNGVLEVLRRLESIPGATEQLAKMVWHGLFSGNVEQGITDIGKPGVSEGKPQKRADRYHINKDGKPASLASYADKSSAIKDRDAKYPDAKVHQVGPRGKVKGEFEEGVAEGKWNYPPEYTKKANADDEAELGVSLINKDARKAWRKKQKAKAHKELMTGKKKEPGVSEGAKVDRMVKHIASSEKATGKSNKDAENIAWATVNKRGYLDNKNKKKHVAEAGTPADIRAKNRAVVKKIQGKEVKEDITQEDIITKLKAKLGDYLSDLGQQIKKDPALQDKLSAETPGDQVGPPVKTLTTDDGHEISIHGNEDDGFRISIKNKQTPSKFDSLDEAVMACEMYRAHRRKQALTADYVEEA
jgi:hypothetical protein